MNTNEPEVIVTDSNEPTELAKSEDFGKSLSFVNPADMPDLDNAEVGMSIEPKYVEFKTVGQSMRFIYNGVDQIKTKDRVTQELRPIPAVILQNKDGIFLNAGASLVQQMQKLQPGTAVQITYSGTERTGSGNNVNKFDVRVLNIPRVSMPATLQQPQLAHVNKPEPIKTVYANMDHKDAYWKMATQMKFTNQEGNEHLAEFGYDFKAALEAITPGFVA